jgi:hypothetical protein
MLRTPAGLLRATKDVFSKMISGLNIQIRFYGEIVLAGGALILVLASARIILLRCC